MIEWAKVEGLREVEGQVLRENTTMLDMCRSLGFSIRIDPDDPELRLVTLPIAAIEEPEQALRRQAAGREQPTSRSLIEEEASADDALQRSPEPIERCTDIPEGRLRPMLNVVALEPADMLLGIELDADLLDEVELGLEEVDMAFLVRHQLLEQVLGHPVADALAIGGGLAVEVAGIVFGRKVAFEDFLDGLADAQRVEHLQVGEAVEEDDALDEAVRVVHLLDGFLAPGLGELLVAPIVQDPVMEPVLVDRRQLAAQAAIEILDNLRDRPSSYPLVDSAAGCAGSFFRGFMN